MAARRRQVRGTTRGFLRQFHRDTRGNAIMIMGFALVPITGMIGSAVDLSRAYLAKTRMQQACDAGALAGRRVLTANVFNDAVRNEATRFFNFNYRQGENLTSTVTPTVTMPTNGVIHVTASGNVPTAVMQLFGIYTLPISVQCDASQDFVNTDIVLVLDNTTSMNCTPSDSINCAQTTEKGGSKMQGVRDAVMALYDALSPVQQQLEANGLRLRYSVVPYSNTVNMGSAILSADPTYTTTGIPSYLVSGNYNYRSRTPNTYHWNQTGSSTTSQQIGSQPSTQSDCTTYGQGVLNSTYPQWANNQQPTTTVSADGKTQTVVQKSSHVSWSNGYCTGYGDTTTTTSARVTDSWTYGAVSRAVLPYIKSLDSAQPAVEEPSVDQSKQVRWAGCIEEADTTQIASNASLSPAPSGAYDMNINLIPNSDATRWRPWWQSTEWYPYVSGNSDNSQVADGAYLTQSIPIDGCPVAAKRLAPWTRANLLTYMNSLRAGGSTYLDNGMRWGARMISPAGIFASDNPTTYNNMPVQRFVIFMTDGYSEPFGQAYSMYGLEDLEHRVAPNTNDLQARHDRRFLMACQATKNLTDDNGNRAVSGIWMLSFGASSSNDTYFQTLQSCASNTQQAIKASDSATLIAAFQAIGNKIGSLRLTR